MKRNALNVSYQDLTFQHESALKRWVQRRRLDDAIHMLAQTDEGERAVLDFGAGDGELFLRFPREQNVLWAYEPAPWQFEELQQRLAQRPEITCVDNLDALEAESFDLVTCLEVFEHLPPAESVQALEDIEALLRPGGHLLIGVPVERHLPALLKGLFRMTQRYGDYDANWRNVIAATLGRPPQDRPVLEIGLNRNYHPHHLGFDDREFTRSLCGRLRLVKKRCSPLQGLPASLNSELMLLYRKD